MNVLVLEHPRIASEKRFNDIANTPLWSCLMGGYAAASLAREGFDTAFFDHALMGASFDTTTEKVLALAPELLCVNAVYFWEHTPALFEFFSVLKTRGFSGHINLFGFFPSLVYKKILCECDPVDSIAVGEFEHTLAELATALKKGLSLENIEGLALRSCLFDNKSRMRKPEKNPDIFAFPQRTSLGGSVPILASRGCYNHCSFCPVPSFYNQGRLWRGRSPENIAQEIQNLVNQGVKDFYFVDPNFIGPGKAGKKRTMDLMDLLRPMGIRFGMETRPQDLDDQVLEHLVAAGFESLLMGVESGSPAVLAQINKSAGAAVASRAIFLCRKHGIEPEIGFLMFVPDACLDDLVENMKFLMKNTLLDRLDRTANLLSHTQIVLAGTSGYAGFEQENRLVKQGAFGFEAEVVFSDPRVAWAATLIPFACHTILRSMSDPHSPIFWKNETKEISQKANAFLVEESLSLISRAKEHSGNPGQGEAQRIKKEISGRIKALLN
ncbi:MAG: B12-binding domain-containing radical SAM protein [Proteobacteria bacterium]|nr:B12-binding domain-containing radical SAM protein [Desulfobacula sp.]MBU4129520.1 B12-binding domain-containing radical SAM protein [Pseudomonadota bacterium]